MRIFAPTPTRTYYASRSGVPSIDPANPQATGSSAVPRLQAIADLNAAGSSFVRIVIDQPVRFDSVPVSLSSGSIFEGTGAYTGSTAPSGIWQGPLSSASSCLLRNRNWRSNYQAGTSGCANIIDKDITIRRLYINGQESAVPGGVSAYHAINASGYLISPIQMRGVTNLAIEDTSVYNPCCNHFQVSNIDGGIFRRLRFFDPVWAATPDGAIVGSRVEDGLHINGPANDLSIEDLDGTTSDDFVALCGADGHINDGTLDLYPGFKAKQAYGGWSNVYYGDIVRVNARNLRMRQCWSGVRFLVATDPSGTGPRCMIDDVTVEGVRGSASSLINGISIALAPTQTNAFKRRIVLRDWQLEALTSNSGGGMSLGGVWYVLEMDRIVWGDTGINGGQGHRIDFASDSNFGRCAINIVTRETTSAPSSPQPQVRVAAGTIDHLEVSGHWHRATATAQAAIQVTGGTVNTLDVHDYSASNLANIVAVTGGTVGGITSSNINHTFAGAGNPSYSIGTGVTVPRFRAAASSTALLTGGAGTITSKKTDGTEDA